jgi:hypothetical protein
MEAQAAVGVIVDEDEERCGIGCRQSGLLAQLAKHRFGGLFAIRDLAAGKLPRTRHVLAVAAPGDEDQAFAHHDREGDFEAGSYVSAQAGAPAAPGL